MHLPSIISTLIVLATIVSAIPVASPEALPEPEALADPQLGALFGIGRGAAQAAKAAKDVGKAAVKAGVKAGKEEAKKEIKKDKQGHLLDGIKWPTQEALDTKPECKGRYENFLKTQERLNHQWGRRVLYSNQAADRAWMERECGLL